MSLQKPFLLSPSDCKVTNIIIYSLKTTAAFDECPSNHSTSQLFLALLSQIQPLSYLWILCEANYHAFPAVCQNQNLSVETKSLCSFHSLYLYIFMIYSLILLSSMWKSPSHSYVSLSSPVAHSLNQAHLVKDVLDQVSYQCDTSV